MVLDLVQQELAAVAVVVLVEKLVPVTQVT